MCAVLPVAWPKEGAFALPPVATHLPPTRPGGTRFYARDVSVGQYFGLYSQMAFREMGQWNGHRDEQAWQRFGTRGVGVLGWRRGLLSEKMGRYGVKRLTSGGHSIIRNCY